MKQKVLNIQLGTIYDKEKKQNVAVTIPAYSKKTKEGKEYFQAVINIFVNEMEVKDKEEAPKL